MPSITECYASNGIELIWTQSPDHKEAPLHLAVGIFDGVHTGHRAVIRSAMAEAKRKGGLSGVLTFDPHPSRLLRPDSPTLLLMPPQLKTHMLQQIGVDVVVWKSFDLQFAGIPADNFLQHLKAVFPHLASIHVGSNFRFGKARLGDVAKLAATSEATGVSVFSVDRLHHNDEAISSSRIRAELRSGDLATVNALLGYNYTSIGTVTQGKQLGRTIGFPTLNMDWTPELTPPYGVYAVRVSQDHGPTFNGVANYGLRPTVEQVEQPRLEVHLLEASCPFTAGDTLTVQWVHFIRPEHRFESLDALRRQIGLDLERAKGLLR